MSVIGGLELGRELAKTHVQIVMQMEEIRAEAERMEIDPVKMRDSNSNYILAPLLAAKAQTLHALVLVNQRG